MKRDYQKVIFDEAVNQPARESERGLVESIEATGVKDVHRALVRLRKLKDLGTLFSDALANDFDEQVAFGRQNDLAHAIYKRMGRIYEGVTNLLLLARETYNSKLRDAPNHEPHLLGGTA